MRKVPVVKLAAMAEAVGGIGLGGDWHFERYRGIRQADGSVARGELIEQWDEHNVVVDEGINHVLDVVFHGGTQTATWYIGIFEGNYTPTGSNTAANIVAAATEFTSYDESARPAFVEAAPSSKTISNTASKATFTISTGVTAKTIYGAFLISVSTKSATTGILMAATKFSTSREANATDILVVSYTISGTST